METKASGRKRKALDYEVASLKMHSQQQQVKTIISEPNHIFQTKPNQTHSKPNPVFFKNWIETKQ